MARNPENFDRNLEAAEALRQAELEIMSTVSAIMQLQAKMGDQIARNMLLEEKINKYYQERIRLVQRLNKEQLNFAQRMGVQAQLGMNTMGMTQAGGDYIQNLMAGGGGFGTFGGMLAAQKISSGTNQGWRELKKQWEYSQQPWYKKLGPGLKKAVGVGKFELGGAGYLALNYANKVALGAGETGMSADAFQRNQYAAGVTQMGDIKDVFGQYKSARDKALSGDVSAKRAFQMAGVNDLSNVNKGFEDLLRSLANGSKDVNKMSAALTIFGDDANQVVNALEQGFHKFKDVATTMPEPVVNALKYVKDTVTTTLQELTIGFGYLLAVLKPFAYVFNAIKGSVAGSAAYIGGRIGGMSQQDAEQNANNVFKNYMNAPGNVTNQQKTDVAGIAGVTRNWQFNPFMGGYSQMADRAAQTGQYLGGAASGVQVQDLTLKNIERYTKQTADGVTKVL